MHHETFAAKGQFGVCQTIDGIRPSLGSTATTRNARLLSDEQQVEERRSFKASTERRC